jgi:HNH endonuclease
VVAGDRPTLPTLEGSGASPDCPRGVGWWVFVEGERAVRCISVSLSEIDFVGFGHICPVVFSAETFTQTTEERRSCRSVPARILMRVARRDNYICQICSTPLRDDEIEFDHIIPVARGGSSEEHNLRVTCYRCNRKKGAGMCL